MSSKKRKSQKIPFNTRKNKKIKDYFSQVPKEEQNDPSISQVKVDSKKNAKGYNQHQEPKTTFT